MRSKSRSVSRGRKRKRTPSRSKSRRPSKAEKKFRRNTEPGGSGFKTNDNNVMLASQYPTHLEYIRGKTKSGKVSFAQKVRTALSETLAKKVLVYDFIKNYFTVLGGQQQFIGFSSYGNGSEDDSVQQLFKGVEGASGFAKSSTILAQSCVMNFILTNPFTVPNIVKVYILKPKRDIPKAEGNNAGNVWLDDVAAQNPLPNQAQMNNPGPVAATRPGVTPFDTPEFCANFTILQCRQYIMPAFETVTFQVKNMKKGKLKSQDWFTNTGADLNVFLKKWSKIVLIVYHGINNSAYTLIPPTSFAANYPASNLNISVNWSYHFSYIQGSEYVQASAGANVV